MVGYFLREQRYKKKAKGERRKEKGKAIRRNIEKMILFFLEGSHSSYIQSVVFAVSVGITVEEGVKPCFVGVIF